MAENWTGSTRSERFVRGWDKIRLKVLVRDQYICKINGPGCLEAATDVDHIDDNSENNILTNLQAVCKKCHDRKSGEHGRRNRSYYAPHETPKSPGIIDSLEISKADHKKSFDIKEDSSKPWIQYTGPMWEKDEKGKYLLPEKTLGYHAIFWITTNLQLNGEPFLLTGEQARFILWFYAIDDEGKWINTLGIKIAPKGWGKDPLGAAILAFEMCGPCRFNGWNTDGTPKAKDMPSAWCQVAAVKSAQNENTFLYLRSIFTEKAKAEYQLEFNAGTIYAYGRKRKIESIASRGESLEGNVPTFILCSETHHWTQSSGCIKLWTVLKRNSSKVLNSHIMAITNTYNPSEDSIAQRHVEAYEAYKFGRAKDQKILLDFKGATDHAPYETLEQRMIVLNEVYGESAKWQDISIHADTFDSVSEDLAETIQFFYNGIGMKASSWVDVRKWDACGMDIPDGIPLNSKIVLALDCSLNQDSTALTAMVVGGKYDKTIFTLGVWEKPPASHGTAAIDWMAPRDEIFAEICEVFKKFKVLAFHADPSHKKDINGANYWLPMINNLHTLYSSKISPAFWAQKTNAFNWDMTSSIRQKTFVEALGSLEQEITDNTIRHDRHPAMRRHIMNARRMKGQHGYSIGKASSQSPDKIDLAVCAGINYALYTQVAGNRLTKKTNLTTSLTNQNKEEITNE